MSYEMISVTAIVPSPYNPRKYFDDAKLAELAASIKEKGVLEPILARPTELTNTPYHEIVAGERRFRAAKAAGLKEIPAIIRDLTDGEAAEIAIIENAQRADLTPVEEARGFKTLIDQFGYTAEDAALKMGLSAKTVAQRIRLLVLPEEALTALDNGSLPLGSAVHLSRLGDERLRQEATEMVLKGNWQTDNKALSPRETLRLIRSRFVTDMFNAGFPLTDETLVPSAGACTVCPHRSSAQPDLFEIAGKNDLCLNTACFAAKKKAHGDRLIQQAKADNLTIIKGKAAKQIFPYGSIVGHAAPYVEADEKYYLDGNKKAKSYKDLVGKVVEPIIAVTPNGDVKTLYPKAEVKKALEAKGIKANDLGTSSGYTSSGKSKEEKEREIKERAEKEGILAALCLARVAAKPFVPKFSTPAQRAIFRALASGYLQGLWEDDMKLLVKALELEIDRQNTGRAVEAIRKWLGQAGDEEAYVGVLMMSLIRGGRAYDAADRKPALIAFDELGIDLKAIRAQHLSALKQKAAGKAAKKAAKPKGGKRGVATAK